MAEEEKKKACLHPGVPMLEHTFWLLLRITLHVS